MRSPSSTVDALQRCNPAVSCLSASRGGSRDSGQLWFGYSPVGVMVASAAAAATATALVLTLPSGKKWCVFVSGLLLMLIGCAVVVEGHL